MYQNQNEAGAPVGFNNMNPDWQPLPIHWLEDFQPEAVEIRLPGAHNGLTPWPRPAGEKCEKRSRPILPGGFRSAGKLFPSRAPLIARTTRPDEQKIRP